MEHSNSSASDCIRVQDSGVCEATCNILCLVAAAKTVVDEFYRMIWVFFTCPVSWILQTRHFCELLSIIYYLILSITLLGKGEKPCNCCERLVAV